MSRGTEPYRGKREPETTFCVRPVTFDDIRGMSGDIWRRAADIERRDEMSTVVT